MGFLQGKRALITGVMSNRSIAYGIAKALHQQGCECAFTYVGDFKERTTKLVKDLDPKAIIPCDVQSDEQIEQAFSQLKTVWDSFDILIHSIAFAPSDQLGGDFVSGVNREGFQIAHDVSAYSLCALAKAARPFMQNRNASIIAMTYLGSERCVTNYNTMGVAKASLEAAVRYCAESLGPEGIRVNAISAGPIKTLAASGIKGFRKMLDYNEQVAPLRKNVSTEDVGNTAAFLGSDLAGGITGEVIHVDAGFNIVGVPNLNTAIDGADK